MLDKKIILFKDDFISKNKLTKLQLGELFLAILNYCNDEEYKIEDPMVDLLFDRIKNNLDNNNKKYQEVIERRRGKKQKLVNTFDSYKTLINKIKNNNFQENLIENIKNTNINKNDLIFINKYLNVENIKIINQKNFKKELSSIKKLYNKCDKKNITDLILCMDYREFLQTQYWKIVAQKVKIQANFKCQLCNSSERLNVHHRTYEKHGYELEDDSDLVCICEECHKKIHNIN